jgi:hypothetical protein
MKIIILLIIIIVVLIIGNFLGGFKFPFFSSNNGSNNSSSIIDKASHEDPEKPKDILVTLEGDSILIDSKRISLEQFEITVIREVNNSDKIFLDSKKAKRNIYISVKDILEKLGLIIVEIQ